MGLAKRHRTYGAAIVFFTPLAEVAGKFSKTGFTFRYAQIQLLCKVRIFDTQQAVHDAIELFFALKEALLGLAAKSLRAVPLNAQGQAQPPDHRFFVDPFVLKKLSKRFPIVESFLLPKLRQELL